MEIDKKMAAAMAAVMNYIKSEEEFIYDYFKDYQIKNINENKLIDFFIQNKTYVSAIVLINKIDLISKKQLNEIFFFRNKKQHLQIIDKFCQAFESESYSSLLR